MQLHEHRKVGSPEAAKYLGISNSTLSKLRVFGGGPRFSKLRRRVLYDVRELDAWFQAQQRTSTRDQGEAA